MEKLYDSYDRLHDYVRLSITDRCNLRCVYCMPKEGLPFFPTDRVLSQDEIVQLIENFAAMGVSKVRITGGEPLLRT
ncbi:MAG: radical SAM protein, partial [Lactiplantibacillus argentoratensis]